jgi:hypothetical protein
LLFFHDGIAMDKDAKRTKRRTKVPTATEILTEIAGQRPQNEPPLFGPNWPKSEFDKLCDEYGGPADLGVKIDKNTFQRYCRDFTLPQILPVLRRFTDDEISARRHWPWAAFAIGQYNFEIEERAKYMDELSPKKICQLLRQIEATAHNLISAITTLQTISFRLHDHSSPMRRGHLLWLNYFISQALNDNVSNEVTGDFVTLDLKKLEFIKRLAQVEAVATRAIDRVDKDLLERERGQPNPALPNFVRRCGQIWQSMTGRKPSTRRVETIEGDDPKFVKLVKTLANIGNAPEPSRKEIETALRNRRATD